FHNITTLTDIFDTEADTRLIQLMKETPPLLSCRSASWSPEEPADALMRRAAAPQVERMILGTHGPCGIDRFRMGSVAARVVRRSEQGRSPPIARVSRRGVAAQQDRDAIFQPYEVLIPRQLQGIPLWPVLCNVAP